MLGRPAETAEAFDDAGGDVGGGRIDHGVVVGEGNVAEEAAVIVAIERAPAAIAILHAQKPLDAAANGAFHAGRIGIFYALEGHQDEGGVVDVGIKSLRNSNAQPPGSASLFLICQSPDRGPVRKHPVRGFDQGGISGEGRLPRARPWRCKFPDGETQGCIRMVSPSSISNRENSLISRQVSGSSGP